MHFFQESHFTVGHVMEIIGKVQQDLSVKVLMSMDFGTDIGRVLCFQTSKYSAERALVFYCSFHSNTETMTDFSAVEAVVDATHRYKEIFYTGIDD